MPVLKPVIPDPGIPFQLVHHDDVAAAMRAAVQGRGTPGVYNLAGDGQLTMGDLADALGWYSIPIPELGTAAAAELTSRLPFMPPEAAWLQALRVPVLMDTTKAKRELGWRPKYTGRETLDWMVAAPQQMHMESLEALVGGPNAHELAAMGAAHRPDRGHSVVGHEHVLDLEG